MRISRIFFLPLLGPMLLSSCVKRIPEVSPSDIPRIQADLEFSPGNPDLLTQLGMAHYGARAFAAAEAALEAAVATGEAAGPAYLYLGLTREDQEDWAGAREAYAAYVERGRYGPLQEEIERRLVFISREELRARARQALAMEDELSTQDPTPGSVAVFPLSVITENQELLPLQVAMADMMTTDLGLSGGLRVLERAQVQSLLTEMALTEAGFTSPETGARAGRMLRAEHVIQGALTTLPEEALRMDTDVLNTERRSSSGEASAEDLLQQLFDIEKETVFRILDILGVEVTPAEREAIDQNRAASLMAFLAYGRGLMAMDEGDYDEAARFFREAGGMDASFSPAEEALNTTLDLLDAGATTTAGLADRAYPELSPVAVSTSPTDPGVGAVGTNPSTSSILEGTTEGVVPNPTGSIVNLGNTSTGTETQTQNRDPTQEQTGTEGVTTPTTASIRITINRPGGGD